MYTYICMHIYVHVCVCICTYTYIIYLYMHYIQREVILNKIVYVFAYVYSINTY